jgi:branched-chain amino acid transport system ATP-binding protein
MLWVKDIRVSYSGVLAVSNVSLHVPEKKIVALVGGNGNGKSTTLRAIAGLNMVDKGEIAFCGQPVHMIPAHKRAPLGLSLVPEGRRLFPKLSVLRNLQLGAYTRNDTKEIDQSIEEMYTLFPTLKERRDQMVGTMSGGEQQMVAIARGLMAKPKLLMLDEPSWGVAPKLVTKILETIQFINSHGVAVLLVEQNLRKALEIADYGYVIQTGRIVMEGKGRDLLEDESIKKAYLGL